MGLTRKRARELAKLRWAKARGERSATVELKADPDTVPPPARREEGEPAAAPIIVNVDPHMGGRKPWPLHQDLVKLLDNGGYLLLRRSPINYQPKLKAASAINSLDLVAVSVDKPGSERQKAFQKIIDQMPGREQLVDWLMMHGFDEGLTFYQIAMAPGRDTGDAWIYPSFLAGGFHKENAAENPGEGLRWNGEVSGHAIAKPRTFNPWMTERENAAGSFIFDDFIVFNPGGGPNTEGNLKMARVLLPLCSQYEAASVSRDDFIELFGVPIRAWYAKTEGARKDVMADIVRQAAAKAGKIGTEDGQAIGARMEMDDIALIEPKGTSSQIILETARDLRNQVHQIWLGNELTSSSQDSGAAGSSTLQGAEQNKNIMRFCRLIAQGICPPLLKWVDRRNPTFPKLAEGESEIFLQFQPEGRRSLVGLPERSPQLAPVMTGNTTVAGTEASMQSITTRSSQPMQPAGSPSAGLRQALSLDNGEIARHLLLAKPADFVLPPVHPNCRCSIVDGEWIDAKDSRVCAQCRAYGALFNAMERGDVKLTDEEADAVLDARNSEQFKRALDGDPEEQQRAINILADGIDREGILQQVTKRRGIPPSPEELMTAVDEALEVSRQSAQVRAGATIGTGPSAFVVPEAVVAPPVAAGVRPQFVGAIVSSGRRYSVSWTMRVSGTGSPGTASGGMRAVLIDKVRDRVITSHWNLWWLLLLLAELERREQKRREEQRQRREAVATP